MTDFNVAEESSQLLRLTSNAYSLTVRQGPERGKAFSGPKEKDRKPVDPPPIIQLQIRDPSDPASNYLQSPYFFMCCNLCDADLSRPGQLSAALQGDDPDNASQSALAGTLVSSLHRLKDVDNSDGGFFVFPDISVRLEGEFRLRFSLFEMLKTAPKVVYIKSVHTNPFTVYAPRTFPGMAESTFLSRSFGDQGVKLRIRKEPRILGKRSAPSDAGPEPAREPAYLPQRSNYAGMGSQTQQAQTEGYGAAAYRDIGYDNYPPSKRHKSVIDHAKRDAYMQEERSIQRSYAQTRDAQYAQYPAREIQAPGRPVFYVQQPGSAQSSEFSIPGHQRTSSTSASSPFASPRTEYPAYSYSNQAQLYQQPRDTGFQYPYNQQQYQTPRQPPQIPQPVPPERQLPSSIPSQAVPAAYGRQEEQQYSSDMRYQTQAQAQRPTYQPQPQQQQAYAPTQQALPRTLPAPPQVASAPALPSLGSSFPPYATTDGQSETYTTSAAQNYASYAYRGGREND